MSLILPAGTFTAPAGEPLTYTAGLADGRALPNGLIFNAATGRISGIAPGAGIYAITVTATNTSGLSPSETFDATVSATAPAVIAPTPPQSWAAGQPVLFALPADTFTDTQAEHLRYAATQANGAALPQGLQFDPATDSFTGTAPLTPQTLSLAVTATDASGLAVAETFAVNVTASAPRVCDPTAHQVWHGGQPVSFALPANTFNDPQGSSLSFQAFETGGPSQLSWLDFSSAARTFSGLVPAGQSGLVTLQVVGTDALGLSAADTFTVAIAPAGSTTPTYGAPALATELLAFHG